MMAAAGEPEFAATIGLQNFFVGFPQILHVQYVHD
jgi:hypothetical protein